MFSPGCSVPGCSVPGCSVLVFRALRIERQGVVVVSVNYFFLFILFS